MAPSSNTLYNPSDNSAPFMVLPEHVYGFIDLKTLADIHRYLGESESQEDIILAKWVQENYLNEPIDQGGRVIRTTEGFSQLDRAYRRVRSLTNKAQDKWPFFDRNWKTMSSTTVRNNARGEAAPGVTYGSLPDTDSEIRASSTTNGLDPPQASPAPRLQVPFGPRLPGRVLLPKTDFPRPSQQTPVPLPSKKQAQSEEQVKPAQESTALELAEMSPEKEQQVQPGAIPAEELPKSTDFVPGPDDQLVPQSEHIPGSESKVAQATPEVSTPQPLNVLAVQDPSENDAEPDMEPLRDAGGGKVRGPNGRYLPKANTSPVSVKSHRKSGGGVRVKSGKQQKAMEAKENILEEPKFLSSALAEDEYRLIDVPSPSPASSLPAHEQNILSKDVNDETTARTPITTNHGISVEDSANSDSRDESKLNNSTPNGSTSSYILAAEAEAVASNLDRLPPGLVRRPLKRKSEPVAPLDQRKRGRHGGVIGRPRKSESKVIATSRDAEKERALTHEEAEETPQMVTRRATRRSGVSNMNTSASEKSAGIQSSPHAPNPKIKPAGDNDVSMEDLDNTHGNIEGSTADHQERQASAPGSSTSSPPSVAKKIGASSRRSRPQSAISMTLSQPHRPEDGSLTVGKRKRNSFLAHSKPKQRAKQMVNRVNNEKSIGTSHTPGAEADNSTTDGTLSNQLPNTTNQVASTQTQISTHNPGHVEYFARVHTFTGTVEIPIATEKVDDAEEKLIKKYAEWMAKEGGTDIPFKQFRSIFGFARED
ncbi:hypothetical protein BKA66DRAFT_312737 [Pyrenochaeta sp. MPI-SDFR-AT-0127]|nr:hypothetical protein BKA66DRAFT_312737 [Pyrenochaeta sp. MPI-SDFR-AT-0127]